MALRTVSRHIDAVRAGLALLSLQGIAVISRCMPVKNSYRFLVLLLLVFPPGALAARQSPVDGGTVTSGVGWRVDPFGSGRMVYHSGWDIAIPSGSPVYPTQDGTVYFAGSYKGYGNLVAIRHGQGFISLYGHNSRILVLAGQEVDTKTVIALSGNTGRSTGPHLHYEVRQLPGYEREQRDEMTATLKKAVEKSVDGLVDGFVSGKGGVETEKFLPDDLHE
jgi:murein DD-endopeptidase MepM/ murein hydrolase activator NlpD